MSKLTWDDAPIIIMVAAMVIGGSIVAGGLIQQYIQSANARNTTVNISVSEYYPFPNLPPEWLLSVSISPSDNFATNVTAFVNGTPLSSSLFYWVNGWTDWNVPITTYPWNVTNVHLVPTPVSFSIQWAVHPSTQKMVEAQLPSNWTVGDCFLPECL